MTNLLHNNLHALTPRSCRRHPGAARATAARRIVCHAGQVQRRERIFRRWSTWSLEQLSTCGDVVWPQANDLNLCSTKQTMDSHAIVEHPLRFDHALVNSTADLALWTSSAAATSPNALSERGGSARNARQSVSTDIRYNQVSKSVFPYNIYIQWTFTQAPNIP